MQEYILEQNRKDFKLFVLNYNLFYLASPTGDIGPGYYDVVTHKQNPFSSISYIIYIYSSISYIRKSNFR